MSYINISGLSKFVLRSALQKAIETEIHLHNNTSKVQYCPDFTLDFEWDFNPTEKTFKIVMAIKVEDLEFERYRYESFEFSYQTVCEWILINAGCYDEVPVSTKRRKK